MSDELKGFMDLALDVSQHTKSVSFEKGKASHLTDKNEEIRLTKAGQLHDGEGKLTACGWASEPLLSYHRSRVPARSWRIKEWDYYLVNDTEYAVALTVADLGYLGLISASVIDFAQTAYKTTSVITPFPLGRFNMPSSSDKGVTAFKNNRVSFSFKTEQGARRLHAQFLHFDGDDDLVFDAVLDQEPQDSLVIATPFAEDSQAFYYNRKIVGIQGRGSFKKGLLVHGFSPGNTFGLLDWGRGVWTRDNTWHWAAAHGWQQRTSSFKQETCCVGLNFGYGFGDNTAASENMLLVDGVAHKLHQVTFSIPKKPGAPAARTLSARYDFLKPWAITDDRNRVELVFTPRVDRADYTNLGIIRSDQHQVFGTFDGVVVLDDGSSIQVCNLQGCTEVVHNIF